MISRLEIVGTLGAYSARNLRPVLKYEKLFVTKLCDVTPSAHTYTNLF